MCSVPLKNKSTGHIMTKRLIYQDGQTHRQTISQAIRQPQIQPQIQTQRQPQIQTKSQARSAFGLHNVDRPSAPGVCFVEES